MRRISQAVSGVAKTKVSSAKARHGGATSQYWYLTKPPTKDREEAEEQEEEEQEELTELVLIPFPSHIPGGLALEKKKKRTETSTGRNKQENSSSGQDYGKGSDGSNDYGLGQRTNGGGKPDYGGGCPGCSRCNCPGCKGGCNYCSGCDGCKY